MRDSSSWMRTLREQLSPAIPIKFSNFARIELMLYALQARFPRHLIRKAHTSS